MPEPMLAVRGLNSWYGESHILHGVDLDVHPGEVVTLLGRNGAGKTTTMKSVMGLVGTRKGSVRFEGSETIGMPAYRIARLGIAFCPEERGIFASLDVAENLMLPPAIGAGGMSVETIFELFPNLKERLSSQGTKLSGGEQQMLAIARTLMGNPRLLLLDEPAEGLAPVIVDQMTAAILALKAQGTTVLLAEQSLAFAARVGDRATILETGRTAWSGTMVELMGDPTIRARHLQV